MSENLDAYSPRPRSVVLIGTNVIVWVALTLLASLAATAVGYILLAIQLVVVLFLTTVAQVVIHFVLRRRRVRPAWRILIFFLPTLALIAITLLTPRPPRPANQQQRSPSPSGKYVLSVPNAENSQHPEYRKLEVWKVTITDTQGTLLYKDDESTFLNHLSVYWVWDEHDRVWLYNSDDGSVYFWELANGTWSKTAWGHVSHHSGTRRSTDRTIAPPDSLYPDYVKKKPRNTSPQAA